MADSGNNYLGLSKSAYYRKKKAQRANRLDREKILRENEGQSAVICLNNDTEMTEAGITDNHLFSRMQQSAFTMEPGQSLEECVSQSYSVEQNQVRIRILDNVPCPMLDNPTDASVGSSNTITSLCPVDKKRIALQKPVVNNLCRIASRHGLTDECFEDILKLLHNEEILSNRKDIPRTSAGFETASGCSIMIIRAMWQCSLCSKITQRTIRHGESTQISSCCGHNFTNNDDHYFVLSIDQVLRRGMLCVEADFSSNAMETSCIALTLNTDGAPLFKSSKSSFWPVLGAFDEVKCGTRKSNILLFGIFVGVKKSAKPNFEIFLEPIVNELQQLQTDGLHWTNNKGQNQVTLVKINAVVCDSIARPLVQNMSQFNAKYGCGYCYHEETGHYYTHSDCIQWRTSLDIHAMTRDRGVKGPSAFMLLTNFDMIYGFPPDVLHVVYLGVCKTLMEAWLLSKSHKLSYYLHPSVQNFLNQRLLCIKPPRRVSRVPRSLDNIKYYKGHEFMMFLLYYSPVVLKDVLEDKYYNNWMLLARGIAILTSRSVTAPDISNAEELLRLFSSEIKSLYGHSYQRFNIHLLLHFGEFVRRYGPLQNYSMTVFESFNMVLKKYVTSANGVGRQICKRFFRDLCMKVTDGASEALNSIWQTPFQCVDKNSFVPSEDEQTMIDSKVENSSITFFSRVKYRLGKKMMTVDSTVYVKSKIRDSTYFMLASEHLFFQAKVFVLDSKLDRCFALGTCFKVEPSRYFKLPHCYDILDTYTDFVEMPNKPELLLNVHSQDYNVFFRFLNDAEAINE